MKELRNRYKQGESSIKLFREQSRFFNFVDFMKWLEVE